MATAKRDLLGVTLIPAASVAPNRKKDTMSNNTNTMPRPSAKAAPAKAAPAPAPAVVVVSLADGAKAYGAALVQSTRAKDHTLALIAFGASGGDNAFAAAASLAAATEGEEQHRAAFVPSDEVPTWDEHLSIRAGHSPYAVSGSTIRNYRNAVRILLGAGLPTDDAVTFAQAKSAAPKHTKADNAKAYGTALAATGDAKAALAGATGKAAVSGAVSTAKADAKAKETKAAREADPVGHALAALLAKAEGDAAALTALAKALRDAATLADRFADAAAGGQAALTANSQVQPAA